jgi:hypothetical protein
MLLGYDMDRQNGMYFLVPFRPRMREGEDASHSHFDASRAGHICCQIIKTAKIINFKNKIPSLN